MFRGLGWVGVGSGSGGICLVIMRVMGVGMRRFKEGLFECELISGIFKEPREWNGVNRNIGM